MNRISQSSSVNLQFALLCSSDPHLRSAIAETDFATLDSSDKANIFPPLIVLVACPPDLRHQRVSWFHGRGKSRSIFFDVCRVTAAKQLQQSMTSGIPRVKAVHDRTAESHGFAWLWGGVKRVIVAIEPVQVCGFQTDWMSILRIRLLALWWREVLRLGALRSTPIALADEECTADGAGVELSSLSVYEIGLRLHYGAGLALVVYANNLATYFEIATFRSGR